MNKYKMLLKAAIKKQKGSIAGIFLLMFVLSICLFCAITVYISGVNSVEREMQRLGFGDFTIWISGQPERLQTEIESLPDVDRVLCQPLIFAGYEINGSYSDDEGQLIVYDGAVPYCFVSADGAEQPMPEIMPGTVYISPALCSSFDVEIGDTIQFELSRSNGIKSLEVAGYFADAFMGSSMIDMKSFLVNDADWMEMKELISEAADVDVLGRNGAMFHIFRNGDSMLSDLDFHRQIYEFTDISLYTEFAYRQKSILNYILLLQNFLSGFLIIFSAVLLLICLIIIGHSLSAVVEQEKRDMAILKTMGLSGNVCDGNSILITDTVAGELSLSIGDTVQVAANGRAGNYTVSGVYQCANGMGSNIGMSLDSYSKIGDITSYIWCYHYILENGSVRDYAMAYLQDNYQGIDVHTNSWSGLSGIVSVMHTLIVVIYLVAALFILVSAALTADKLLQSEAGEMAIYKGLGMSSGKLRFSFALRFLIIVIIGAGIGICLSEICADFIIGSIFKMFGIGEFSSDFSVSGVILPMAVIPLLFFGFALAFSAKLKQISIINLISENMT